LDAASVGQDIRPFAGLILRLMREQIDTPPQAK
jgi:homoserine trans-succinylase